MGWGGDVITFYTEWHKAGKPASFCEENLFHRDPDVTSFSLGDFLEDAGAPHSYHACRSKHHQRARVHHGACILLLLVALFAIVLGAILVCLAAAVASVTTTCRCTCT